MSFPPFFLSFPFGYSVFPGWLVTLHGDWPGLLLLHCIFRPVLPPAGLWMLAWGIFLYCVFLRGWE